MMRLVLRNGSELCERMCAAGGFSPSIAAQGRLRPSNFSDRYIVRGVRGALIWSVGVVLLVVANSAYAGPETKPLVVASKSFTESRILGELMAQMIEAHTEVPVKRKMGLGGTLICFTALKNGEVDLYPDYTGTAWAVLLKETKKVHDPLQTFLHVQRRFRKAYQIALLDPFGLNNSYALAMVEAKANALGIRRISDLVEHGPGLKAGVSMEFLNREDGYPGLEKSYGLKFQELKGMEHGLAYEAIVAGQIDVIDAYTTDGKLLRYKLRVLQDDRRFFPPYNAAPLVRQAALDAHPEIEEVLGRLAFRLMDARMQHLNHRVETDGLSFSEAAREFLVSERLLDSASTPAPEATLNPKGETRQSVGFLALMRKRLGVTLRLTWQHLFLTVLAVALATLFAVPLGISMTWSEGLRKGVLGIAGVLQTIPSLALLAFMIPIPGLGLGVNAAVAALFLYAVLPILRNTYTGITEVDPDLLEAARGIGLTRGQILVRVELPLAARTIMAGIRTSMVISVGVATLAAFIGAGGLGEPILTGLQLSDTYLILSGAIPAALLALLVDFLLGWTERGLTPRGLEVN